MKLIVGLGNPGKEYENTRHNVGFIILDSFLNGEKWKEEKDTFIIKKKINEENVIFIKPLTYMNLSGLAVSRIAHFYKVLSKDILVIHDDLDLPILDYRFKFCSSAGGHNGIKNIIDCLGTKDFSHLKVGISNNKKISTKNYVLAKLSNEELEELRSNKYKEMLNYYLENDINKCMNKYN